MKISVNILTWNNQDTIYDLLNVLWRELEEVRAEIVLIDNGSTDETKDIINNFILEHAIGDFKVIYNDNNLGISKGKNQGINNSHGEYILMLDGDVVPVPNSIIKMIDFLDTNPDKHTIGMYPNKFFDNPNSGHETYCEELIDPRAFKCCCLYYGLFRRSMFAKGLRMCEEGEMGKPGYGWEDHDFFKRMKKQGYDQYVADINHPRGRYYHKINSSIRAMGREKYRETSMARSKQFKELWDAT